MRLSGEVWASDQFSEKVYMDSSTYKKPPHTPSPFHKPQNLPPLRPLNLQNLAYNPVKVRGRCRSLHHRSEYIKSDSKSSSPSFLTGAICLLHAVGTGVRLALEGFCIRRGECRG